MTPQQLNYYNQIIQYLLMQPVGFQFVLDKNFYIQALPNITLTTGDKIGISRYFKQQVAKQSIKVDFDYIFSKCTRCGCKDNTNHIHYKTI